jgi:hypothetical protein
MTSVVDTSVKNISSAMVGAPVVNGVAGSFISFLNAFLVDGFDLKTGVSITVANGVATASWTGAHSCDADTVVSIAGVTGSLLGLNGEQKIATKPNAASATWLTNEANGSAAGAITMKMAPLGWTKVYSSGNVAVYKSSDPAGSGMLLRVDDSGTTSARVVGYEAMTDINTGINPFPTAAQISGGGYWPKSTGANANAVQWYAFGDSRAFYYAPMPGTQSVASSLVGTIRGFGDPIALKQSGDIYACFLNYSINSAVASQYDGGLESNVNALVVTPRSYAGIGAPVLHTSQAYMGNSLATAEYSGASSTFGTFPSDVDGSLLLCKKFMSPSGQRYPRAEFPGLYHIPQSLVFDMLKPGGRQPGSRDLAGKNVMFVAGNAASTTFGTVSSSSNTAVAAFDTTGPWR